LPRASRRRVSQAGHHEPRHAPGYRRRCQSSQQTTDDYGTRIWSDVSWERERWVLVSILFDEDVAAAERDMGALYEALYTAVDDYLE
jgi:hypothetical protein